LSEPNKACLDEEAKVVVVEEEEAMKTKQ